MKRLLLGATILAAMGASPVKAATQISVENIGAIFNESLPLPAEDTPGSGIGFAQYFEFTLPTRETVTISMSDSAIGNEQVTSGVLGLNNFTSTGPAPLFIPAGALIESSAINDVLGGQEATVAPDVLNAGAYFAEISGISGASPIHIAIDGTATAVATPEISTWSMIVLGFGLVSMFGLRRRKTDMNLA
jgi:hypothetical protein